MNKLIVLFALAATAGASPALARGKQPHAGQTRAQALAAAGKQFARFDSNGDGTTDTAEMTTALQTRATAAGKTFRPKTVKKALRKFDTNADGRVTLAEAKTAAGTRFDQVDTNKNGVIDPAEVASPAPAAATVPATTG